MTVFLAPECCADWAAVLVEHPTGVVYQHQYGGTATLQAEVEGYLVPLPVPSADSMRRLRTVFVSRLRGAGAAGGGLDRWPDLLDEVRDAVGALGMCPSDDEWAVPPTPLAVDDSRRSALDEAFVPVLTPDGPGWLVWNNSD